IDDNVVTYTPYVFHIAAGIPDFRSSSSGIYDNLEEFNLPHPMAVFSLDYFKTNPKPFFEVARRLYRPHAKVSIVLFVFYALANTDALFRSVTTREDSSSTSLHSKRLSGLSEDKFVEAHGTFHTGHCQQCHEEYTFEYMRDQIIRKEVPKCSANCNGVVKPDVVLFGENLPRKFYSRLSSVSFLLHCSADHFTYYYCNLYDGFLQDFSACDLLLIMGTSLQVLPFAGLIHRVGPRVPRLYLNREYSEDDQTGFISFIMRFMVAGFRRHPLRWGRSDNTRDVFVRGDTDSSVLKLAELLGW
ncbi:transcriptional regulator, Sir2 family, partial [Opisthorchis viverrini]